MENLVDSALLLTLRRCVRKNLRPLNDMPHCEKGKRRSHATAQRRNVKARVIGDTAMSRLTVTGLNGFFPFAVAPFDDKGTIAPCGLHLTALRNIS